MTATYRRARQAGLLSNLLALALLILPLPTHADPARPPGDSASSLNSTPRG